MYNDPNAPGGSGGGGNDPPRQQPPLQISAQLEAQLLSLLQAQNPPPQQQQQPDPLIYLRNLIPPPNILLNLRQLQQQPPAPQPVPQQVPQQVPHELTDAQLAVLRQSIHQSQQSMFRTQQDIALEIERANADQDFALAQRLHAQQSAVYSNDPVMKILNGLSGSPFGPSLLGNFGMPHAPAVAPPAPPPPPQRQIPIGLADPMPAPMAAPMASFSPATLRVEQFIRLEEGRKDVPMGSPIPLIQPYQSTLPPVRVQPPSVQPSPQPPPAAAPSPVQVQQPQPPPQPPHPPQQQHLQPPQPIQVQIPAPQAQMPNSRRISPIPAQLPAQGPLAAAQVPPSRPPVVQPTPQHQLHQPVHPIPPDHHPLPPPPAAIPHQQQNQPRRGRGSGRARGGGGRGRGGGRGGGRGAAAQPPRVDEALAYLRVIKQTFANNVDVYHKFLEIMKDFRAHRINTPDVIVQVTELLYEHIDLVLGFNTFLPTGYSIGQQGRQYMFSAPNSPSRLLAIPPGRGPLPLRYRSPAPPAPESNRSSQPSATSSALSSAQPSRPPTAPPGGGANPNPNMVQAARPRQAPSLQRIANGQLAAEPIDTESDMSDDEDMRHEGEVVVYDLGDDEEEYEEEYIREDDDDEDDDEDDEDEEEEESTPLKLEETALRVVELLGTSFTSRPSKLTDFVDFMEFYMQHINFAKKNRDHMVHLGTGIPEDPGSDAEEIEDPEQPGPAPPAPPREVPMETEGSEIPEELRNEAEKGYSSVQETFNAHLISMLVDICEGEPSLLAATLQFLPYLENAILKGGLDATEKVCRILKSAPSSGAKQDPEEQQKLAKVGEELMRRLEDEKIGRPANEKLRISKRKLPMTDEEDEAQKSQELMVLDKMQAIIYEHIKHRTDPHQIKNLVTLISLYRNMDITKEKFVGELPKIFGSLETEVEVMIKKILGIYKEPKDRPENDVDAVMSKDLPVAPTAKRGLRDQKTLQQVKIAQAATVCTLGPSYRLMKDSNSRGSDCSGRIELDPELKETINDTWTSYPSWSSEEVGTQAIKKSNLEEFYFKTEDERYELDIIVDSNRTVIEQLSKTLRDIEAMSEEERKKIRLNDALNCSSRATINRVLIKVYTNSASEIVAATQKNPITGLRRILESLKEKDVQWSKFQQETNRTWRDALDKQMSAAQTIINNQQKQFDQKSFKSKLLVQAIEAVYEERKKSGEDDKSPHMSLEYTPEARLYRDVNDVATSFFHELPGAKCDKDRARIVLFRILMEWLYQPPQHVQVDMENADTLKFPGDKQEDENLLGVLNLDGRRIISPSSSSAAAAAADSLRHQFKDLMHQRKKRVFYGDDNVYMIIRYHHILIERFAKILSTQTVLSQEHLENERKNQKWEQGVGAEMRGVKVMEELVRNRREAVNDIRNIRTLPSGYYDTTLRELKSFGNNSIDLAIFEETMRNLFPGDISLFNSIDKLFSSLAKNTHHATCADEKENAVKLYLKFRKQMMEAKNAEEYEMVVQAYAAAAEEQLRGKNTYRFEMVEERNLPFINIWVIPREEKESANVSQDDEDRDDPDGGDGKDAGGNDPGDETPSHQPPSNDEEIEEMDEEDSEEMPSGGGAAGGQEEMDTTELKTPTLSTPRTRAYRKRNSPDKTAENPPISAKLRSKRAAKSDRVLELVN